MPRLGACGLKTCVTTLVVLDTTIVGLATQPALTWEFDDWLEAARSKAQLVVPSVCDYEVRRELVRISRAGGIARLDSFVSGSRYEDMNTERWHIAARLWAAARNRGRPTADANALDIDVLVAAIAVSLESEGDVIVATSNVRHLGQFVDARLWREITFAS